MKLNITLLLVYLIFGISFASASEGYTPSLDPVGLVLVIVFYFAVVLVGVWASKKQKNDSAEEWVLAGRSLSGFVGIVTMVSTWVCGGYLYGTTQAVMTPGQGLAWAQAPWGYSVCFFVGSILFCKKMRESEYITMLDPFQAKFGRVMTSLLYIPTVLGDVFWIAMALATLGACLSVLIGFPRIWAIIVSAIFSAIYTLIGGMYSVAYTDVVQLVIMFICLVLCLPFVLTSKLVNDVGPVKDIWLGHIDKADAGLWVDYALLLIMGGIPWQVYFQRVLASKTVKDAQIMSFFSGVGAFLSAIPAAIMGIYGTTVDWGSISETMDMDSSKNYTAALSYILKYLTPKVVGYIGLGGIAAATMSTADSAMLASSTVFTLNVYKPLFRPNASSRECNIVSKIGVFIVAAVSVVLAITSDSVYALWVLTSDFIYVIIFPQLLLIIYYRRMNVYGSFVGYIVGFIFRIGLGEPAFSLKPFITLDHQIPAKTLAMLLNLICIFVFTELTRYFIINLKYTKLDFAKYYTNGIPDNILSNENVEVKTIEDKDSRDKKDKLDKIIDNNHNCDNVVTLPASSNDLFSVHRTAKNDVISGNESKIDKDNSIKISVQ